jgi:NADH-quinone oxidoreductase subunit J
MANVLFNLFTLLTVAAAAGVVLNRNAVNAALCLLLSLVGVAGLFVALNAYLLAFLLLLVYAGAIVALFLFIVMLLNAHGDVPAPIKKIPLFARVLAFALVATGVTSFAIRNDLPALDPTAVPVLGASLKPYAHQLFTTYLLPVQVLGFLLLIAMIGVIVLSKKFEGMDDIK